MKPKDRRGQSESHAAPGLARRAFLIGSTAIAAGGGLAAAVRGGDTVPESADRAADPRQPEYRETEHIRKFYALSRF